MLDSSKYSSDSAESLTNFEEKVEFLKSQLKSFDKGERLSGTKSTEKRPRKIFRIKPPKAKNLLLPGLSNVKSKSEESSRRGFSKSFSRGIPGTFRPPKKKMVFALTVSNLPNQQKVKLPHIISNLSILPEKDPPDWHGSILQSYVKSGVYEFNKHNDPSFLSEELLKHYARFKGPLKNSILEKAKNTIKILQRELNLNGFPSFKNNQRSILNTCQQLMDARNVTVQILVLIKEKEEASDRNMLVKARILSGKILALINNWKALNVPFSKFVYKNQDYSEYLEQLL